MTAKEAVKLDIKKIPFGEYYGKLLGHPQPGFLMIVHGPPWNGKTFFSVGFAKYLAENFGNVLYATPEQYGSLALQSLLSEVKAGELTQMVLTKKIQDAGDLRRFDFLFIDSATAHRLRTPDIEALREKHPSLCIVVILQSTKDGGFRGGQEWAHDADIKLRIENCTAYVDKNRFLTQKPEPLPVPFAKLKAQGKDQEAAGDPAALNVFKNVRLLK